MSFEQLYMQVIKEYQDSKKVLKTATGVEGITAFDTHERAKERLIHLRKIVGARTDGKALFERAIKTLPDAQKENVYSAKFDSCNDFIKKTLSNGRLTQEEQNSLNRLTRSGSDFEALEDSVRTLNEFAKARMTPEEYAQYEKINFFGAIPTDYLATGSKVFSDLIKGEKELNDSVVQEFENFVPTQDLPESERTVPVGFEHFPASRENLSKEENDALDYIEKNVRYTTRTYGSFLESRNAHMMDLVKDENKIITRSYNEAHPEEKNIIAPGMTGTEVAPGKNDEFEELSSKEFEFSEKTRSSMSKIMHSLDELDTINNENLCIGEEETKVYGCAAVFKVTKEIDKALAEGRIRDLPRLTKEYDRVRKITDEMLDIAKNDFKTGELNYVDNLDVARTGTMPADYRSRNRDVTCVASLYCSLKICKILGVSIDDYLKEPNRYLNQARTEMIKRYDPEKATVGCTPGEKLFYLKHPTAGVNDMGDRGIAVLCMRACEGFRSMEGDPKMAEHNLGVRNVGSDYYFNKMIGAVSVSPLSVNADETVQNMLLFDENKPLRELSANPLFKYDPVKAQTAPTLNTDEKIRSGDLDYEKLTEKTTAMYRDYMKTCYTNGFAPIAKMIKSITSLSDRIVKVRPEEAEKPQFQNYKAALEKMTAQPTVSQIVEMSGEGKFNEAVKTLSLSAVRTRQQTYDELPLLSRIAGYLPFVHNEAYELRKQIRDDKEALLSNGVTKKEIKTALTQEKSPEPTPTNPGFGATPIEYQKINVRTEKEQHMDEQLVEDLSKGTDLEKTDEKEPLIESDPVEKQETSSRNNPKKAKI